jgi:enoyl-CoA hydratase/carnithine racemase
MVVKYEHNGHIATVTLQRPDQMNAQNLAMRKAMVEAWREIDANDDVWLAIVTGAGKAFSAGHDLKEKLTIEQDRTDPGTAGVYHGLHRIRKPVLAAINGHCLAQGAGLALLTDIRIASEEAQFGWPQVKRGIASVSGPTELARILPHNVAFEFLFTGQYYSAQDALRLGLVNKVVPSDKVMETTLDYAERILQNAPLAVRAIKEIFIQTQGLSQVESFYHAETMARRTKKTEDAVEGLAAFAEKREPVWRAR